MASDSKPSRWLSVAGVVLVLVGVLGAAPAVLGQIDTDVTTVNSPPLVSSVTLSTLTPTPMPGTTTAVTATIVVSDANGFNDIQDVTLTLLDSSSDEVRDLGGADFQSGSLLLATYSKAFTMNFYDPPGTYKVKVTVTDTDGATGTNLASLTSFTYGSLTALSLPASAGISFTSSEDLGPGNSSGVQSLDVTNAGNVVIDIQVHGTDLVHETNSSAVIPIGSIAYDTTADMTGAFALTTSAQTDSGFDLGIGDSSSKTTYWQLTVPSDDPLAAGSYTGTVTIAATTGS